MIKFKDYSQKKKDLSEGGKSLSKDQIVKKIMKYRADGDNFRDSIISSRDFKKSNPKEYDALMKILSPAFTDLSKIINKLK